MREIMGDDDEAACEVGLPRYQLVKKDLLFGINYWSISHWILMRIRLYLCVLGDCCVPVFTSSEI